MTPKLQRTSGATRDARMRAFWIIPRSPAYPDRRRSRCSFPAVNRNAPAPLPSSQYRRGTSCLLRRAILVPRPTHPLRLTKDRGRITVNPCERGGRQTNLFDLTTPQLGDIRRNPSRLVFGEQLCRRPRCDGDENRRWSCLLQLGAARCKIGGDRHHVVYCKLLHNGLHHCRLSASALAILKKV